MTDNSNKSTITKTFSYVTDTATSTIKNTRDNIKLPNIPEYVLFGLIFVNFFPLNNFPKIYPPKSVEIQISRIKRK